MSMHIRPMLCELGSLSTLDALEGDPDWIVERKYDGERMVAQFDKGVIHLWTRRDISVSHKFPEIITAIEDLFAGKKHSVIDGELIVGSHLKDLAKRQIEDKLVIKILSKKMPAKLMVFDVLILDGKDVRGKALSERKKILRSLVDDSAHIAYTPSFDTKGLRGRFESLVREGAEGIIMKRIDSTYQADVRSRDWLKLKKSIDIEVEIIGAARSEAGQAFKSLIMVREGKYFGQVGTGFPEAERRRILDILKRDPVELSPVPLPENIDPVVLCKPKKALIKALEISNIGMPRAPVWIGFKNERANGGPSRI